MPPRVTILDDSPSFRMLLQVLFERNGYIVEAHAQSSLTVTELLGHTPDLIVVGELMLFGDKVSAVEQLRSHSALADTPIVALTTLPEALRWWGRDTGDEKTVVLSKLDSINAVQQTVCRLLKQKDQREGE
jgi:CheY-like chemotaxis protein